MTTMLTVITRTRKITIRRTTPLLIEDNCQKL